MIRVGNLLDIYTEYDVITHSCNCFCVMASGIAPQLAKEFGCDKFTLEGSAWKGSFNKLGCIDYKEVNGVNMVNSYMQYHYRNPGKFGIPFDYDACKLCLRKIEAAFPEQKVLLPMIGCGLAKAEPSVVLSIIQQELSNPTVVVLPGQFEKEINLFFKRQF